MLGLALPGNLRTTRCMNLNCSGVFIFLYLMLAFFLRLLICLSTGFFRACIYVNGQLLQQQRLVVIFIQLSVQNTVFIAIADNKYILNKFKYKQTYAVKVDTLQILYTHRKVQRCTLEVAFCSKLFDIVRLAEYASSVIHQRCVFKKKIIWRIKQVQFTNFC